MGVSESMCLRICAIRMNCRMAVVPSCIRDWKFTLRGSARAMRSSRRESCMRLGETFSSPSSSNRVKPLCNCVALMRKCRWAVPRPTFFISDRNRIRRRAIVSSVTWAMAWFINVTNGSTDVTCPGAPLSVNAFAASASAFESSTGQGNISTFSSVRVTVCEMAEQSSDIGPYAGSPSMIAARIDSITC